MRRSRLRTKLVLYLVLAHLVFIATAFALLRERPVWLLVLEGFFVLSLIIGLALLGRLFEPIRLIRSGVELLEASEFAIRFREVGQPDLDPLIQVYNRMADTLREERIRSEEQEHFLQRIVTASPSGILTLDLDGRIAMANPAAAALLHRNANELVGHRLEDLGSPLAAGLAELDDEESRLFSVHGSRRVRCQALSFMDRGFTRRFVVMDELTKELHSTEKAAYEQLIRTMSHEVNNTSGAVSSLLDSCLAYADQIGEADRQDFVDAMGVAIGRTGRMNRFMQEYADVVRLPRPTLQSCDLGRLVEEVAMLLKQESDRRGIAWQLDIATELPAVSLDPAQIEQVLLNVCRNAIEAIGEDGTIAVRLDLDNGRPAIAVRDTGSGIPAEVHSHLFTPFFSTKKDGQGIGLTVVREVLQRHGFEYALENVEQGGAEFRIRF